MARTGLPLTVYGVVVIGCRLAFARTYDRFVPLQLGAAALGMIATGLVLIAIGATPAGLVVGSVILAVGVSFATPAFFSAIFATAAPSQRGAAAGTGSISIDLGVGAGPIVAGAVAGPAGIPAAFAVMALVALAGVGWTLRLSGVRPARRRRSPVPAVRPR